MPAGTYTVYVNQPDFFASPKVVGGVTVQDGQTVNLNEAASMLSRRLSSLFLRDDQGRRPFNGGDRLNLHRLGCRRAWIS